MTSRTRSVAAPKTPRAVRGRGALLACLATLASLPALARPLPPASEAAPDAAADSCAPGIASAETAERLPAKLLGAIALVESGRQDPATGRTTPWPWTINAAGIGHVYATKADAIAAVRDLQALGVRSIDVGCMQINLLHHPAAFATMDQAFDPMANAAYGARFLGELHRQTGSWPLAAAAYHSQTPDIGQAYEIRVMAIWPLAARYPDLTLGLRRAAAPAVDYSRYTPEFAAKVRQMVDDRARLAARFGTAAPAPALARVRRHLGAASDIAAGDPHGKPASERPFG